MILTKHRTLVAVLAVALLLLAACESRDCTLVAGVPVVVVDTTDFPIDSPEDVEVCLDDQCVPINKIEEPSLDSQREETEIGVQGDNRERTIMVRSRSGQVLAGPTVVELQLFEPNGKGCPGAALQGHFWVNRDGTIE